MNSGVKVGLSGKNPGSEESPRHEIHPGPENFDPGTPSSNPNVGGLNKLELGFWGFPSKIIV